MVINDLLKKGLPLIEGNAYGNPILEVVLILGKLLKKDKEYIYSHGEKEVSQEIIDEFMEIIKKRAQAYPMAYILGHREFMGLDFLMEEGVLIARPDSEILAQYIIKKIKRDYKKEDIFLLEIGIGSGAIGLSLAKEFPKIKLYGLDIDERALELSRKNQERLGLENVSFFKSDLFQAIDPGKKFHIIFSNPPYIKREDLNDLQRDVRDYEPMTALDGGQDGLDFYRRISREAKKFLEDKGLLAYEIGYNQARDVEKIMIGEGFTDIEFEKDLQGYSRIISGRLK